MAKVRGLVDRHDAALARPSSGNAVNRGVVGVEEAPAIGDPQNVSEVGIDDPSVAHDEDSLT